MVSSHLKFRWCIKIYNSPHTTDIWSFTFGKKKIIGIPASKREFETLVGCGERNKDFNDFFNDLINKNVLICKGIFERGRKKYICTQEMYNYLKNDPLTCEIFKDSKSLIDRERII